MMYLTVCHCPTPVLGYLGSKLYLDIGPVTGSLKLVNPEPGIPGPGGWLWIPGITPVFFNWKVQLSIWQ